MIGEYDAGYEGYIDTLIREADELQAENAKLRELVEGMLDLLRLGLVSGEGISKRWCRDAGRGDVPRRLGHGADGAAAAPVLRMRCRVVGDYAALLPQLRAKGGDQWLNT